MPGFNGLPASGREWFWQRRGWLSLPCLSPAAAEKASRIERIEERLDAISGSRIAAFSAEALAEDLQASWAVEGIELDAAAVRFSLAKRLGMDVPEWKSYASGIKAEEDLAVRAAFDLLNRKKPVSAGSVLAAHGKLEPPGTETVWGRFRRHEEHVVASFKGTRKIVYVAPPPEDVPGLMRQYADFWHDSLPKVPCPVGAALAHLYFVIIHPFEDGNGRMGRLLAGRRMAEGRQWMFPPYSVSSMLKAHRKAYAVRLDGLCRPDGLERFLRFALDMHEDAALAAESRAKTLAELEELFAGASFLTDEQRHIVRVMAMNPGRKWLGDEIFADMEDDEAACLAWDDLAERGCIREGRLHLDALRPGRLEAPAFAAGSPKR